MFNKNLVETKIVTVDNLFIIHGKVSLFTRFGEGGYVRECFLKTMNNKSTLDLLKK